MTMTMMITMIITVIIAMLMIMTMTMMMTITTAMEITITRRKTIKTLMTMTLDPILLFMPGIERFFLLVVAMKMMIAMITMISKIMFHLPQA